MVHIKKVEIFGFKSFGFRNTAVAFEPGLVSISGPNGSGKSNILDAIIFAMGENRPKVMRVDRLRSLLHDVEGQRRGPKLARVNVTFDNSDRRIPVDSDTVDVTREMDEKGENTYYLNRKHANRGQILDLLDVANAGLNQLNAVQQGTVTRISEFSPEEKRQTIEDLVGLSYFDQKKTEAVKQLDEADRRLEIALAKMGEIKKRIDELEEERNQKLRHDALAAEIARLNAVSAAGRLRAVRASRSSKEGDLGAAGAEIRGLEGERGGAREGIGRTDAARSAFLEEVNAHSKARREVDSELSAAMQRHEEINGAEMAARRRASQIGRKIPEIEASIRRLRGECGRISEGASAVRGEAARAEESLAAVERELRGVDGRRSAVLERQSTAARRKAEADGKLRSLADELNASRLALSRAESDRDAADRRIASLELSRSRYREQSGELAALLSRFERRIRGQAGSVAGMRSRLRRHGERRAGIVREIDELGAILEKSVRAAAQYETKIRVVKGIMHEDYSIARLQEDAHRLGIDGLAYQLVRWDRRYERAALAAGADWIKAFVVQDLATQLGLAESAREKSLPKLKIIPLEAIPDIRIDPPRDAGAVGVLSDFVGCRPGYERLRAFLFGDVVLAKSRESAYRVSQAGHRAVTLDGDLFEARASAMVVDASSRISKLTRIITMSSSVEGLLQSIALLRRHVGRKRGSLRRLDEAASSARDRLGESEAELASTEQSYSDLRARAADVEAALASFEGRMAQHRRRRDLLAASAAREGSSAESISGRIRAVREGCDGAEQEGIAGDLEEINAQKSSLEGRRTGLLEELRRRSSDLAAAGAEEDKARARIRDLEEQAASLAEEGAELESGIRDSARLKEEQSARLVELRQREQAVISASGDSVSRLRGYDDELRGLHERDRILTRRIGALERRRDSLSRDLADLRAEESRLAGVLRSSGVAEDVEAFDAEALLSGLQAEQRSLVALNAKAPETYLEVSGGYRSMSARKNSLEEERNSIVRFIEEVEKDKRQTFLDAFDRVDKEIRKIFSGMTGGEAWLELQNEDDIFSSGISYLIQFRGKSKRESTSISGGEKTLAAIVFVLALQRLKPSPFYLFDEVDAHLDAPNSERLSAVLEERSHESQFIMVSLKDSVVQKAGLIYGVFPKNNVSHVVTYRDRRAPRAAGSYPGARK